MKSSSTASWVGGVGALLALLLAGEAQASGKFGSIKPDGTNVWIGAASGGSMSNVANWRAESPKGYTVEELMKMHCVFDLRGLENGAVVTNDLTLGNTYANENGSYNTKRFTLVAGIIASGAPGDNWTVVKNGGTGLFFTQPCYLDIDGGRLVWEDTAGDMYPYKVPTKRGTGTFAFKSVPTLWETDGYVDAGTLEFTNNASATTYRWKILKGGKIDIATGTTQLSQVYTGGDADANTILNVRSDATLKLCTGFNNYNGSYAFYGDLTGSGVLQSTGGAVHKFQKGAVNTLSFTGTLQPYVGDLSFGVAGTPLGVNPATSVDVAGQGWLRLYGNQSFTRLSGAGSDGGVHYPATSTLTVTGPSAAETNTFHGRLAGGAFVKTGADYTLVMTGANIHTGETRVAAGTLALKRGFQRKGLRAYWTFDDPDDMGADVSVNGLMPMSVRKNPTFRPYLVEDGVCGRAVHFGNPGSMANGGLFMRANMTNLTSVSSTPSGAAPFTFSFWMRPTKGKCGNGTNFIHIDSGNGTYTNETDVVTSGVNWGSGFFFGSPKYDESTKASLSSLQNLCFYCGCGWTRGGVYADDGKSSPNTQKVAIAKFSNKDYLFDGKWHHVVGTYSNRIMRIFVDGVKMDERTRSADLSVSSNPYAQFGNYSGDTAHTYQGDLDEIQWLAGAWSEDEVAAEYAAKNPRRNATAVLPAPIAHWTFDEQKADHGYADVTGNGFDLENVASNGTHFVQSEPISYPEDSASTGAAAVLKYRTSYLQLRSGVDLTTKLPVGSSFTLSMRCAYPGNGLFFIFGDGTNGNSVRLGDSGCPRLQYWYVGDTTKRELSDTGSYGASGSFPQSAYLMDTIVYNAENKSLQIYRDAKLVYSATGKTFSINPTMLKWGCVGTSYFVNLRLDDMRIYNEALTCGQVEELARRVRGSMRAQEAEVLPAASPVVVDAGATLAAMGLKDHAVGALRGAGTVDVRGGASFRAADYSAFTGTISGTGFLRLADAVRVPSTATVTADVRIDAPLLARANAGTATPFVTTSGRVVVPSTGTIRVSDATQGGQLAGKRWALAAGSSFVVPTDLSGWTVEPAPDKDWEFKTVNGTLYFAVKGGGTLLTIR